MTKTMETVVLKTDIARLVLGYLQQENLDAAARIFCKTSSHLRKEFSAYKRGLRAHSFFPELEEIICEHVKIIQIVNQAQIASPNLRTATANCGRLSEKVNAIINVLLDDNDSNANSSIHEGEENDVAVSSEDTLSHKSSVQSDKENDNKRSYAIGKRKRSLKSSSRSSSVSGEEQKSHNNGVKKKRRRLSDTFCYIPTSSYLKSKRCCAKKTKHSIRRKSLTQSSTTSNSDSDDKAIISQSQKNKKRSSLKKKPSLPKLSKESTPQNKEKTKSFQLEESVINPTTTYNEIQKATTTIQNVETQSEGLISDAPASVRTSTGVQCNFKDDDTSASAVKPTTIQTQLETEETTPRTPIIIRNAISSVANVGNNEVPTFSVVSLPNNTSMVSDPNFSISKLIVLNSNENAQKQHQTSMLNQTHLPIGNTTVENVLNQLTSENTTIDEQVFFDASTGQQIMPMFLTNDQFLQHFPFLVGNDINTDGTATEVIIKEPFLVADEQTSSNSLLANATTQVSQQSNSATKISLAPNVEEKCQRVPVVENKTTNIEISNNNVASSPATTMPSSNEPARVVAFQSIAVPDPIEKETPTSRGIMNFKAFKSLSTPRKQASHVRTLTFSPKMDRISFLGTPISTRNEMNHLRSNMAGGKGRNLMNVVPDKPIIENVEILPNLSVMATANDSSNSCSVPPLFACGEEVSNQTVVNANNIPNTSMESKDIAKTCSMVLHPDTPKKKGSRKCKRQLSQQTEGEAAKEEEKPSLLQETAKPNTNDSETTKKTNDPNIEEWRRMRQLSTVSNLDTYLRKLNAEMGNNTRPAKRETRKKTRRRKIQQAKTKASNALEIQTEAVCQNDDNAQKNEELLNIKVQHLSENENSGRENHQEFSIKIPTPNKGSANKSKDKRAGIDSKIVKNETAKPSIHSGDPLLSGSSMKAEVKGENLVPMLYERDKRTANIACLLDTPFKDPNVVTVVHSNPPPTPGVFLPSTPFSKMAFDSEPTPSSSYIFGSLTKSELNSPLLNAITPGFRLTPFGIKDTTTPRSGTSATEYYSSGSSYYRPDESEDLDKNFEKLLHDSAKKKEENRNDNDGDDDGQSYLSHSEEIPIIPDFIASNGTIVSDIEGQVTCELPVQTLKVEPLVLKRVKSFGETVGTEGEKADVDPHYKLVSGFPDNSVENFESSSSSSCSSSSDSDSSPSVSTSSSSSSSSSSSTCESDCESRKPMPDTFCLTQQSLSDISSTEDEDWQKLTPILEDENNTQLIKNDGEIRYPVRSWCTPSKGPSGVIRVPLPIKSAEKRQFLSALEEKRQRMKEKIMEDCNKKINKSEKVKPFKSKPETDGGDCAKEDNHQQRMEVLSALKLSAKKQSGNIVQEHHEKEKFVSPETKQNSPLAAVDDNAVSHVFENAFMTKSTIAVNDNPLQKVIRSIKKSIPQKKCQQISARPIVKRSMFATMLKKDQKSNSSTNKSSKPTTSTSTSTSTSVKTARKVIPKVAVTQKSSTVKRKTVQSTVSTVNRKSPRLRQKEKAEAEKKNLKSNTMPTFEKKLKDSIKSGAKSSSSTVTNAKATGAKKKPEEIEKIQVESNTTKKAPVANHKEDDKKDLIGEKSVIAEELHTSKAMEAESIEIQIENVTSCEEKRFPAKMPLIESTATAVSESQNSPKTTKMPEKAFFPIPEVKINSPPRQRSEMLDGNVNSCTENEENSSNDDEEDEYEKWEFKTATETDRENFFSFVFTGTDNIPPTWDNRPRIDLSKNQIVIGLDENESRTLRVSEEICIFSTIPKDDSTSPKSSPIKIIPKKRKHRISNSDGEAEDANTCKPTIPVATSTPELIFSKNSTNVLEVNVSSVELGKHGKVHDVNTLPAEKVKVTSQMSCANKNAKSESDANIKSLTISPAERLQIGDIESILSHLHGT